MSDDTSREQESVEYIELPPGIETREELEREVRFAIVLKNSVLLTWVMIGLNVILFIGAWIFGDLVLREHLGLSAKVLNVGQLTFLSGMKLPDQIAAGQWWRLITAAFVHMDWSHILFNGYGLYVVGPIIEKMYGKWRWIVIYLGSAVLSSLASFYLNESISGGASGAIYGLVGAALVFGYKYREQLPARVSRGLTRGMLPWVVFGIGVGFLDILPMDNAAHIGGILAGALIALAMKSELVAPLRTRRAEIAVKVAATALLVATLLSFGVWVMELDMCTPSRGLFLECYPQLVDVLTESVSTMPPPR